MLVEQHKFQDTKYKILEIFDGDIPRVIISSSLPITMRNNLLDIFSIFFDWQLYQEKTILKNVEYIVVNTTRVLSSINKIYLEELKPRSTTAIVYLDNTEEAIELGRQLSCKVLHDDMSVSQIVQFYEDRPISNNSIENSLIVATSKINHGGILFGVSHIITVGSVKNITEFQRVVEHLWRDEEENNGKCYFLLNDSIKIENESPDACINGVLSREFDAVVGTCKTLKCLPCSVFDPSKVINEVQEIVVSDQDNILLETQIWTELRNSQFNLLRFCGIEPKNECVLTELGCPGENFFRSLIRTEDILVEDEFVESEICMGCFFRTRRAEIIDPQHIKERNCSLRGITEALILLKLFENGIEGLDNLITTFGWHYDMAILLSDILKNRAKYRSIFKSLQFVPSEEATVILNEEKFQVMRCINMEIFNCRELVYENSGTLCELLEDKMMEILRCAYSIFSGVNSYDNRYCGFCWGEYAWNDSYHRKCEPSRTLRILVYS